MFNEVLILQTLTLSVLFFFLTTFNLLTLWYLGGIFLTALGLGMMLDDGDIFIGFLWVIDLGVGLVFFIFILHYSTFTYQKPHLDKSSREFFLLLTLGLLIGVFFLTVSGPSDAFFHSGLKKTWFFLISWYEYSSFYTSHVVTDLNLLKEVYFFNNSFEFFLINFLLFYGILSSILMCFLVKRVFTFMNAGQLINFNLLDQRTSLFFIRNQNFLKQQSTSGGSRVWLKKKHVKL
jgi:hypothetical protein